MCPEGVYYLKGRLVRLRIRWNPFFWWKVLPQAGFSSTWHVLIGDAPSLCAISYWLSAVAGLWTFLPHLQLWSRWYKRLAKWLSRMAQRSSWSYLCAVMSASSCCLPSLSWRSTLGSTGQSNCRDWASAASVVDCVEWAVGTCSGLLVHYSFLGLKHAVFLQSLFWFCLA